MTVAARSPEAALSSFAMRPLDEGGGGDCKSRGTTVDDILKPIGDSPGKPNKMAIPNCRLLRARARSQNMRRKFLTILRTRLLPLDE